MITPQQLLREETARWICAVERLEYRRGAITHRVFARQTTPDGIDDRYYEADSLQLAKAIYDRALRVLRAGRVPDLQATARELKRRDRSLITTTRRIERNASGAVLLGDTPFDEIPGQESELVRQLRDSLPDG